MTKKQIYRLPKISIEIWLENEYVKQSVRIMLLNICGDIRLCDNKHKISLKRRGSKWSPAGCLDYLELGIQFRQLSTLHRYSCEDMVDG